jgi:DNA-binding CsgD family transcriptional regulator
MAAQVEFSGSPSVPVGRADELRVLNRHAEKARAGSVGLVTMSGAVGTGKTTVLRAFLEGGGCRDMSVLFGSCAEIEPGAEYSGVRELFGSLDLGDSGKDGTAEDGTGNSDPLRGLARRALPALTAGPVVDEPSGASAAYQVLQGLYRLAVNLMADGPLVLALDDVHKCDERSLRWLDFLLRRADGLPLLVVLALRDEDAPVAPGALADIAAHRVPTALRLAPLSNAEAGEIVRQFFPTAEEPGFMERAAAVSGGNPRVLSRLLGELLAEGVRPDQEGIRRVAEAGGRAAALSVRAVLERQLPWVRDVATAIAVLGEESEDIVGALADVPPTLVAEAVLVLRETEVVAPDRADLICDVARSTVLQPLDEEALAELRTRAALLLSDAGRPAEHAANHLMPLPAVDRPWMSAVLRDAAAEAGGRGAPEAAVRYLDRVLKADPESVSVRVSLAAALAETSPSRAAGLLEEALERAGDVRTMARIAMMFGQVCLAGREGPAAVRVVEEVLNALKAELGAVPTPADRELCTRVESVLLMVGTDEKSTISTARDRAALLTPPPGDTPAQRQLLATMTVLTAMDGSSVERTVEQARRALRFPGPEPEAWPLATASFSLGLADEVEEALDSQDRMLRHGQENGAVWTCVRALASRAFTLHGIGAMPDALADARTAIEILGEESRRDITALPRIALATVLIERDEPERAEELLGGIERAGLDRFVIEYHLYLMAKAGARAALGDREGALGLYLRCGASMRAAHLTNPVFLPWWVEAGCLLAIMNRPEEAREITEYGSELAQKWGTPRAIGSAALARGATSPGAAGIGLLTESVLVLADSPARGQQAKAEYFLGRALLKTGDQRAAREHLRTAAGLAQRCGALAPARAARTLLVTAGGRMRRMSASPLDMLTGMERKVAGLAAAGGSNRSIAESLFVTVRTVETHLTSVYRKLGLSRRTELASILGTPDIADPQPPDWVPTVMPTTPN